MKFFKWGRKPSGYAPVQADGYFLGYFFYFRSRWEIAAIDFAETKDSWWCDDLKAHFELKTTKLYKASWISHNRCKWLVYKGCLKFFIHLFIKKIKNK